MTKAELRKEIAARKKSAPPPAPLSAAIVKRLQAWDLFQKARSIGVYMPLPDEVDIAPLLPGDAASGIAPSGQPARKTFFIPAFDESIGSYRMAKYVPELRNGKFGIPEPLEPVFAGKDEMDLILVPGIAFDPTGRRVGRGGGFYDRLLPLYRASRVGICFDFQCLDSVPSEPHDSLMDVLLTESRFIKVCDER